MIKVSIGFVLGVGLTLLAHFSALQDGINIWVPLAGIALLLLAGAVLGSSIGYVLWWVIYYVRREPDSGDGGTAG